MTKGQWVFGGIALAAIILAAALAIFLQPEQPNFAGDRGYQEQAASYRAGGSGCEPAKISALPAKLRQGKADTCAKAEEEHRQTTNSLIENRRAAIATEASAAYTAAQARIEAWGAGIGFLTLIAAIAAATFAKKAADHTERGASEGRRAANAAEDSLKVARDEFLQARAGLRAWIMASPDTVLNINEGTVWVMVFAHITNTGQTPAMNCTTVIHDADRAPGLPDEETSTTIGPNSPGHGSVRLPANLLDLYKTREAKRYRVEVRYKDVFTDVERCTELLFGVKYIGNIEPVIANLEAHKREIASAVSLGILQHTAT
jgi:hypothetical protein